MIKTLINSTEKSETSNSGFSIIEVMVAISIFGIVLATTGTAFASLSRYSTDMEVKSGAIHAAQQVLDSKRQEDLTTFPTSGSDSAIDVTVDTRTFQIIVNYCSTAAFCASTQSRHIGVDVYFNNEKVFDVETVYTTLR